MTAPATATGDTQILTPGLSRTKCLMSFMAWVQSTICALFATEQDNESQACVNNRGPLDYWLRGLAEMPDRKLPPLADLIEKLVNEEDGRRP